MHRSTADGLIVEVPGTILATAALPVGLLHARDDPGARIWRRCGG
jgi:hypothetical protein